MTSPVDFPCRSFVYRKLLKQNANFDAVNGGGVARDFGDQVSERETVRRLGLADLSPLPRLGVKGAGTADWLASQGITVPAEANQAVRQASGVLAARLAPAELLLLGELSGEPAPLDELAAAWCAETMPPVEPRGYLLPRQHSHFWFLLSGDCTAGMFAKICGVDLRPGKFENGRIAQTSIARMNAVVIRDDRADVLAYNLLGDSASAEYLWDCLLDAMAEFDGAPVGLEAVKGLGETQAG